MHLKELPISRALILFDYGSVACALVALLLLSLAVVLWTTAGSQQSLSRAVMQSAASGAEAHKEPALQQALDIVKSGPLALDRAAPVRRLPDLRDELIFRGINGRPDAAGEERPLLLGLAGNGRGASVAADLPVYLAFDHTGNVGQYTFSPDNRPTNLWITVTPQALNEVEIRVKMATTGGEEVLIDQERERFVLKADARPPRRNGWRLGKYRVDGGLLARMRTRWFGTDVFLTAHGGSEYARFAAKQRVDFGDGEESYSVYVEQGDCLIWKGNRWQPINPAEPSSPFPLLEVSKTEEKLMVFDLWAPGGIDRVRLSLMRSRDLWMPSHHKETLRFVAARTWSQIVLDTGDERMDIRPLDWLLLQESGWRLLEAVDEVDAYIHRKVKGELLVIDGIQREGDEQLLVGHLFNSSRSGVQQVEIPLVSEAQGGESALSAKARFSPMEMVGSQVATAEQALDRRDGEEVSQPLANLPKVMRGTVQRDLEQAG